MQQPPSNKRTYRRQDEWQQLVSDFENSDLSTTEFCAQHGIASSGLYSWRKKFQQASSSAVQQPAFIELPQSVAT